MVSSNSLYNPQKPPISLLQIFPRIQGRTVLQNLKILLAPSLKLQDSYRFEKENGEFQITHVW